MRKQTGKDRRDESTGMERYWNSPAGRARRRAMSAATRGKTRRERSMTRERRKHYHKKIHIIPDAMAAGGLLFPFVSKTPQGNPSPIESLIYYRNPQGFLEHLEDNIKGYWKPTAELLIGSMVVKYVAKKVGLNRVGTKDLVIA